MRVYNKNTTLFVCVCAADVYNKLFACVCCIDMHSKLHICIVLCDTQAYLMNIQIRII